MGMNISKKHTQQAFEKTGRSARDSLGAIGAAVGALVGGCLAYAANVQSLAVMSAVVVGAICGNGAGRMCGAPASGSQPARKISRMRECLNDELANGMDEADRRKANLCGRILLACFLTTSCYAFLLMVLESANVVQEYLRFFAPLTGFVSDFFPRADAVRGALQEHGYGSRANYAEHMIVMARLFNIPAFVAMAMSFNIVYRGYKSGRIHCTRRAFNGYFLLFYLVMPLIFVAMLALETGYWVNLDFHTPFRSMGGITWTSQYHHTNTAALNEAVYAGIWPIFVYNLRLLVVRCRAQLIMQ